MNDPRQAYDFFQCVEASRRGKQGQEAAEEARKDAAEALALAERLYRVQLAKRIVELKAEGMPATVCQDLARGDNGVADLRYTRDVAQGVLDVAEQRAWRHAADRRDILALTEWSRIVAPLGEQRESARAAA
jgi:hypothetical protein